MSMIGRVMIEVVSNQGTRSIKKIMVYDNGGSAGVGDVHAGEGVPRGVGVKDLTGFHRSLINQHDFHSRNPD